MPLFWRFTPPDLATLFPSTGKWEISFLAMCCFLVWERSNCFSSWGKGNGVSITSAPPVSFWMFLSTPFLPLLPPLFFLSVSPLSILPICHPFQADICCQLALLFCSSNVWLRISCSLSFSQSLCLLLCLISQLTLNNTCSGLLILSFYCHMFWQGSAKLLLCLLPRTIWLLIILCGPSALQPWRNMHVCMLMYLPSGTGTEQICTK